MTLSPQERAEEIHRWLATRNYPAYATMDREYIRQCADSGIYQMVLPAVLIRPEIYPLHFEVVLKIFATLKLIGE